MFSPNTQQLGYRKRVLDGTPTASTLVTHDFVMLSMECIVHLVVSIILFMSCTGKPLVGGTDSSKIWRKCPLVRCHSNSLPFVITNTCEGLSPISPSSREPEYVGDREKNMQVCIACSKNLIALSTQKLSKDQMLKFRIGKNTP